MSSDWNVIHAKYTSDDTVNVHQMAAGNAPRMTRPQLIFNTIIILHSRKFHDITFTK